MKFHLQLHIRTRYDCQRFLKVYIYFNLATKILRIECKNDTSPKLSVMLVTDGKRFCVLHFTP
jgi:hypothetical protein